MTFTQEMEFFFRPYTQRQRDRVESNASYQKAWKEQNAERAQRIAVEILEGSVSSLQGARILRELLR